MIFVNEPSLGDKEVEYVTQCVKTGWVSSAGKFIGEFEKRFAEYCGMKYGVAVSSGTAALQAAVGCLDLKPGEEVIMPTFTIISCALAVIYNGAVPVLVDADPRTWCMNVSQIEEKITPKTCAIMPVHIYGHPVDMDPVLEVARKNDLVVIEDAAEAHGAEYKGKKCGGFGDISCFSFYANKLITTGEGGMCLTNDEKYAEKLRSLRNLCFRQPRFYHTELGHNFRLTNMQAALGLAQVERMERIVERKRRMGALYNQRLADLRDVLQLPTEREWAKNVYWMYGVVLKDAARMNAAQLAEKLLEKGIQTRPFFLGMHEQPALRERGLFSDEKYAVAERLARQGLYLPSGLALTKDQIEHVCLAVQQAVK